MTRRRWSVDNPNFDLRYRSGNPVVTGCCIFCNLRIHIPLNKVKHICYHKRVYLKKNNKKMPTPKYY